MNPEFVDSPSVDPQEVTHYHALADTWWDQTGPFWPLHRLNELRTQWIERCLQELGLVHNGNLPFADLHVLDVGCGGGILSESLAERGADVLGIDVVEKNIHIAQLHAKTQTDRHGPCPQFQLSTVENLAATGKTFDVVFNMEVVEHVRDLAGFMAACSALVKPGGIQFVASINRNWLAGLVAIFGAEYVLKWLPKGTHRYALLRKPAEIQSHLNTAGLSVYQGAGVAVNPFNRQMKIVNHTLINYMLCAQRHLSGA